LLRVAIVLPTYFERDLDFIGGGDRYAYRLAHALQPHCEVTFVSFGPRHLEMDAGGMRHIVLKAYGSDPENPVPGLGFFNSGRFDLIHVFQVRSIVTSVLSVLAKMRRVPLAVTDLGGGGTSLMFRLELYRLIRRFILISDFSRDILPPSVWPRAAVVKGGIDLEHFRYDPRPRSRQVILVSRIMPHKGQNYLIEAAGSDIPVIIAGRIKDERYYQYLQELSRGKQVTFLTDASDEAVLELYRTSAVTVAASVYRDVWGNHWPQSELLGLTMLESMATGTPVVCTNVGALPEYEVDGVTGFVIPPSSPDQLRKRLDQLLGDPRLAMEMGKAGNAHVQQYSWDRVAGGYAAEYERFLKPEVTSAPKA
jgi:glycosyltransferase involved in cell wall biosynthesis